MENIKMKKNSAYGCLFLSRSLHETVEKFQYIFIRER